jgi:TusA-related sulfurtransferase
MANLVVDTKGWKCPRPTLEMTIKIQQLKKDDILEVIADCPTFESDVRSWCLRMNKNLLWFKNEDNGVVRCQIKV